jgi:hypothetical protein
MLSIIISISNLTPFGSALLGKPPVVHLLRNFLIFYETERFIGVFKRALH